VTDEPAASKVIFAEDIQELSARMLRQGEPYAVGLVVDSLTFASLRCSTMAELIDCATDVTNSDYFLAIKILRERNAELTTANRVVIASKLRGVITDDYRASLPPKVRSRTDKLFGNLSEFLEPNTQRELARTLCVHHLRVRRASGARILRKLGPLEADMRALVRSWQTFHDADVLFVLTRMRGGLAGLNCCDLLEITNNRLNGWDPEYLHAVILERLILDQQLIHEHAVAAHTIAYIRAIGRARQIEFEDFLLSAISELCTPDTLRLAASVAGRLRSRRLIGAIEARLEEIVDSPRKNASNSASQT
jgi:hypothetical protein